MTLLTPPGYLQGGTYTAKLDRMFVNTVGTIPDLSGALLARQGFYSGRRPFFANAGGMNVTIGPTGGIIKNTFVAGGGDYKFANDANLNLTSAASSPTQNRIDIYGFQVKDHFYDASGLNTVLPVVVQGANSAGTPADPALPASFIPVMRGTINAAATSPTLASMVQTTVADGGMLTVATATLRNAISNPWVGLTILRTDRLWEEWYTGSGWHVDGIAVCASVADRDSADGITHPYNGQEAITLDTMTNWVRQAGVWVPLLGTPVASTQNTSGTTTSGIYTTTLTGGTTCSLTFVAPAHGGVYIANTLNLDVGGGNLALCSIELRAGAVVGSGTVVLAAQNDEAVISGSQINTTRVRFVSGLTPGSTYNVQQWFATTAGTATFKSKHLNVSFR